RNELVALNFPISGISLQWGYIDKENQEILPFKYDIAEPFYNNIARVGLYGKSMKINKQGSECL
ncbi:WG repeat-containing protein, partial [Bacteroides finegoldii]